MGKVVRIPGGNLHPGQRPSKKLEMTLINFIIQQELTLYDDEANMGIYKIYFRLKSGICVQQAVTVGKEDYVCRTTLSCHTEKENKNTLTSLCILANTINCEIDYGSFEIDCNTGDIRYKTYLDPGNTIYDDDLSKLLGYPLDMIEKYGEAFLNVLKIKYDSVK